MTDKPAAAGSGEPKPEPEPKYVHNSGHIAGVSDRVDLTPPASQPTVTLADAAKALASLRNEVMGALTAFDPEIRAVIGNANFRCIANRCADADKLLALLRAAEQK